MERVPARLHVLLARRARVGVVFRRGPSRQVATLLWDLETDRLTLGQWLKGAIYERRADLSPDGRHMIYFAGTHRPSGETGGTWTAVSRAPYLKALALWGKGDAWCGGGWFLSTRDYWIWDDGPLPHRELRRSSEVRRAPRDPIGAKGWGECPGLYYPRLVRDGWERLGGPRERQEFARALPRGWRLIKAAHAGPPALGRGCYWDEHWLEHPARGELIPCPGWEWADRDRDRLLYAEAGSLWQRRILTPAEIAPPERIADLDALRFEAIAAPY